VLEHQLIDQLEKNSAVTICRRAFMLTLDYSDNDAIAGRCCFK